MRFDKATTAVSTHFLRNQAVNGLQFTFYIKLGLEKTKIMHITFKLSFAQQNQ